MPSRYRVDARQLWIVSLALTMERRKRRRRPPVRRRRRRTLIARRKG
jgi:hypothetical protein